MEALHLGHPLVDNSVEGHHEAIDTEPMEFSTLDEICLWNVSVAAKTF
jgi:hypothetical protein